MGLFVREGSHFGRKDDDELSFLLYGSTDGDRRRGTRDTPSEPRTDDRYCWGVGSRRGKLRQEFQTQIEAETSETES